MAGATGKNDGVESEKFSFGANYWKLWSASVVSNLGDGVATIAYPWLASAVTRDAFLIALIAIAQKIPWLIFTLPAGVITDRVDRRKIMAFTAVFRAVLTFVVALVVSVHQGVLPSPDVVARGELVGTNTTVYLVLLVSALLFGFAEVLYDNAAQTIIPSLVEPEALERANGRLWGAEMVMNQFAGPPLGSLLIGLAFSIPFFFDAGTFAVAAVLIFLLRGVFISGKESDDRIDDEVRGRGGGVSDGGGAQPVLPEDCSEVDRESGSAGSFMSEMKEGVSWLWAHPLLRPLAIVLGLMNGLFSVTFATMVLFAQEVLSVTTITFAILMMAGAGGGVIGSLIAPRVSERLGRGRVLHLTLITEPVFVLVIGLATHWSVVWVMFFLFSLTAVMWNVVTVSLRQTIIPDRLLGRVNSVYRLFAWGAMPVGLAIGGLIVTGSEALGIGRILSLRLPYFISAVAFTALFFWAAPKLTTEKIEAAREAAEHGG